MKVLDRKKQRLRTNIIRWYQLVLALSPAGHRNSLWEGLFHRPTRLHLVGGVTVREFRYGSVSRIKRPPHVSGIPLFERRNYPILSLPNELL